MPPKRQRAETTEQQEREARNRLEAIVDILPEEEEGILNSEQNPHEQESLSSRAIK